MRFEKFLNNEIKEEYDIRVKAFYDLGKVYFKNGKIQLFDPKKRM